LTRDPVDEPSSLILCPETGAECGTIGYCSICALREVETQIKLESESSRSSVQMLGVILALVAVSTLAMGIGLVWTVGSGLKWW
jgi:hypothetical protein